MVKTVNNIIFALLQEFPALNREILKLFVLKTKTLVTKVVIYHAICNLIQSKVGRTFPIGLPAD